MLGVTAETCDTELIAWEARQREEITKDPLWRLNIYRETMFLLQRIREDVREHGPSGSYSAAKEQLLTAVGSIVANVAEGYGRPTTADRVRFMSYAFGSVREAVVWCETLRPSLVHAPTDDRIARLVRIRRMLIGLLVRLRSTGGRKFDKW